MKNGTSPAFQTHDMKAKVKILPTIFFKIFHSLYVGIRKTRYVQLPKLATFSSMIFAKCGNL